MSVERPQEEIRSEVNTKGQLSYQNIDIEKEHQI